MIGQRISHYKILDKLGEGGMGVVYKAEDTKLEREVAIKFLPHHIAANSNERARFKVEAKAAAGLNHNNIATIYSIEEVDDEMFIVMEYIKGQELKDKIELGPLTIDDTLNLAIQIAKGLQVAHTKGVVHRDIKSANIMLTDESDVKIMDFGLAKVRGGPKLTKDQSTLGTASYMSPEQTRGEEVDHRTDIFSLGVLIYEMLTGQLPFKGDYEQAITYSILNEDQEPITGLRTGVSMELERIVNKCLEKEPSSRYQHTDELGVDLGKVKKELETKDTLSKSSDSMVVPKKRVSQVVVVAGIVFVLLLSFLGYFLFTDEGETTERIPIVVADFINETDEKELNSLSGLLITSLEQSRRLSVFSRSRMFDILKLIGKEDVENIDEVTGREICKKVNVNALAITSIRKFDQLYSIDLKIIDPSTGEYIYTTKVEGEGKKSIPSLIDRLSLNTRNGLQEKQEEIEKTRRSVAEVTTLNLEAYQHYFKGEEFINKVKMVEARQEFEKAIALDSTFGLAYYRLAYALSWARRVGAKAAILNAVKYIDKVPEKEQYLIKALNEVVGENRERAIVLYKELLELYPSEKEALYNIGDYSHHLADYPTATIFLEKVLVLDPMHERAIEHLIWNAQVLENWDKMIEYAKLYVGNVPSMKANHYLAGAYTFRGDFDKAFEIYRIDQQRFPNSPAPILGLADIHIARNEYERAEIELRNGLQTPELKYKREVYRYLRLLYMYLGTYDSAIKINDEIILIDKQLNDGYLAVSYVEKAQMLIAGHKDNEGAREAIERALRLSSAAALDFYVPLFDTYLRLGEYKKAAEMVLQRAIVPYSDVMVRAYQHQSNGNFDKAVKDFQLVSLKGYFPFTIKYGYELSRSYYEIGKYDPAIEALRRLQKIHSSLNDVLEGSPVYILDRAIYYPKSFYLLGKIYEKKGDTQLAIQNYEKILDLWKDADEDLPDLIDAKARLAKLKGVPSS